MPKTIIKLKTYKCPHCDYAQDFEPTAQNMAIHFPGIPENHCPACFMGKCPDKIRKITHLAKETNPDKKTTITIMGEDELDTHEIPDGKDAQGKEIKRKLTPQEKEEKRAEIKAAIIKFKVLEDL